MLKKQFVYGFAGVVLGFSTLTVLAAESNEVAQIRIYAEYGAAWAQNRLGLIYETGYGGVTPDINKAIYWYRKAAMQGYAPAQCALGGVYLVGKGSVPKDEKMAVYWYRKSAEQGLSMGQYALGECYRTGLGVQENEQMAIYWLRKAAENGSRDAKRMLKLLQR